MLIEIYTLNIYARMRKVINFDKMKRKNWKKKFLRGLTIPDILPFRSLPSPLLKIFYLFCYIISYNLTKFVIFFLFFFLDNVMLS